MNPPIPPTFGIYTSMLVPPYRDPEIDNGKVTEKNALKDLVKMSCKIRIEASRQNMMVSV